MNVVPGTMWNFHLVTVHTNYQASCCSVPAHCLGEPARAAWAYSGLLVAIFVPVAHSLQRTVKLRLAAACRVHRQPAWPRACSWVDGEYFFRVSPKNTQAALWQISKLCRTWGVSSVHLLKVRLSQNEFMKSSISKKWPEKFEGFLSWEFLQYIRHKSILT